MKYLRWGVVGFFIFSSVADWATGVAALLGWYTPSPTRVSLHAFCSSAMIDMAMAYFAYQLLPSSSEAAAQP